MTKFSLNVFFVIFVTCFYAQSPLDDEKQTASWNDTTEVVLPERDLISPNPTYGLVNFDLTQFEDRNFRVVVKNIIAREIWSKSYNERKFDEDFGFLDKGTYVLAVEDTEGFTLFSRRLIIITP